MKKILLIAWHFPPFNSVASSRTYGFARYLSELGYRVTVLTADHRGDGCNLLFEEAAHRFEVVTAATVTHRDMNRVLLAEGGGEGGGRGFSPLIHRLKKRLSYHVIGNALTSADRWLFQAMEVARTVMARERHDVIISSFSPISCHLVAWDLRRRFPGVCWVADYRDLWSENRCVPRAIFPLSLLQSLAERLLNRRADLLVTVSEPLREVLAETFRRKTYVVENGYFPDDAVVAEKGNAVFPRRHTFCYTGSIYRQKQDPTPFFRAVQELVASGELASGDVEIRFYGENSRLVQEKVDAVGLGDLVRLLPMVSRAESLAIQRSATGLLFLESDNPESRGVLTGKLFEYITSGTPVIAVGVSTSHAAGALIAETNTGRVCGTDVPAIKEAIMAAVAGERPVPRAERVEAYRRDRLVARLAAIIEENCQ